MPRTIDLHSHSHFSDGTLSPAEVVGLANRRGVELFVLTDHDTVAGVAQARAEAGRLGQRMASGIEINTREAGNIHILGYGIDPDSKALAERLAEFRERRQGRARRIVEKLRGLGIDISYEEVGSESRETIGRPHIADALRRKRVVGSRSEAFEKYLGQGKPGFVAAWGPSAAESITAIREAGGWAVLAHPGMAPRDFDIAPLVDAGLEGIEAYYGSHTGPQTARHLETAARFGLIATGGSDFHGPKTGRDKMLRVRVPDEAFARIEKRLEASA